MSLTITTSVESARGCGYRSAGKDGVGIYLMGSRFSEPCERLSFPLHSCPTCGSGIKRSRGWTWIEPAVVFAADVEPRCDTTAEAIARLDAVGWNPRALRGDGHAHGFCPLCSPREARAGLLWVGEQFYPTPTEFMREAAGRGVSRKIAKLPRGFVPGETVVYLAHSRAVEGGEGRGLGPGVITAFVPAYIDLVVDTTDPAKLPEKAVRLAEKLGSRGRLVKVVHGDESADLGLVPELLADPTGVDCFERYEGITE